MSRTIGTVVRGVRAPIFRQGDDVVSIAADTVANALAEEGITPRDKDVVAITESVVARCQGNYATVQQIAADVKAKTGRPMLSGQAGAVDTVLIMLQSCGASMFNEDGSVNLKDNEQLKEVIDFYATMVKEGIFIEVNTWDEYIGTLSNQTVVGTIQGCWILSTVMSLQDQKGLWAMTNLPKLVKAEGATNYSSNGGSSWAVINGKDVELAVDFMKAYRNVDFYNTILPTTSDTPS